MVKTGDQLLLDIEKPAAGGRMIAHAGGQVVLVSGAIPLEQAQVRIDRVGKGVAFGHVVSVARPSPDRREPFCDPECGGSLYAHIGYERQTTIKGEIVADALQRIGKIPWAASIPVEPSPEAGYRMRARLHLSRGRLGFFREASHEVCDARATRQLLPGTSDVLQQLAEDLAARGIAGAEIDVSENVTAAERVLHVEVESQQALAAVSGLSLADATGVIASVSSQGAGEILLSGSAYVNDTIDVSGVSIQLRRHVRSFFQGNRFLLDRLVAHVVGQTGADGDVMDLYAGVGLFSVAIADSTGASVTAVEGDAVAADDLRANATAAAGRVEPVHASVEMFTARRRPAPAAVLVDPPRTGLSPESAQGVVRLQAPRVVYVSCDVATLARDARTLTDAGYRLQSLRGFDLFPNTPHVETVAVFVRT